MTSNKVHVLIAMFLLVRRHSSTESSARDLIGSKVSAELCSHLNVQVGTNKLHSRCWQNLRLCGCRTGDPELLLLSLAHIS